MEGRVSEPSRLQELADGGYWKVVKHPNIADFRHLVRKHPKIAVFRHLVRKHPNIIVFRHLVHKHSKTTVIRHFVFNQPSIAVQRRRPPMQFDVAALRHQYRMLPNAFHVRLMLIVVAVAAAGCLTDAEHSNPLDPNADAYEAEGIVEGRTTRFYPPHPPVERALVRLTPGPYVVESASDGSFTFDGIPVGTYAIAAEKDGFASAFDSVTVRLGSATDDVRLRLNGMPAVVRFDLRTIHISRWWPQEDLYILEIVADVEDPDGVGDVESVWLEIPSYGLTWPLSESGTVGRFSLSMPADSLPAPSLHALQGTDLVVHVDDAVGAEGESEAKSVVRVIDYIPLAVDPQGLATVEDGRPSLVWEDAALPFEYTYRIDIVRDEANVQAVVETIGDIPSSNTSYSLETPLMSGTYFWTVSVVDTFGNRSRSKEAGFVVP